MTKIQRKDNLLPGGIPKWIRVYDNGEETADRYTVIFSHAQSFYTKYYVPVLAMSENPYHPQGVGMHLEYKTFGKDMIMEGNKPGQWPPAIGRKGNLGKRIEFKELPEQCQRLVMDDYCDYWKLFKEFECCGGKHIIGYTGDCRSNKDRF
jgi:hypothetical protein